MPRFGWMRLAYLLFALTVLIALARVGNPDAEARSLSVRTPDLSKPSSGQEAPEVSRLTEDAISSLEDIRGSTGSPKVGPNIAEPRLPAARVPTNAERRQTVGERGPAEEQPTVSETGPPVFYRPPDPGAAPDAGPVCGNLSGSPRDGRVVFPLDQRFYYSYEDTWGAPRTQGGHEGTDLMTPAGVPEYAVTDGTVVPVAGSDTDGWNTLGGYAVMVRADYSIGPVRQGDLFYYAHLERESALPIGTRVQAGQVVGYAGDTGQGPPGTRGLFPPHLHLGWYDGTGDREQADSGAMNPYPLLEWVKSNGGAVTGGSDARFCEAPGPPPSAEWPDQGDPGISPDLDTGSDDPRPSTGAAGTNGSAKKPERSNRPPKKEPNEGPEEPQDTDRPQNPNPPKPVRPTPEPSRPAQPAPGQERPTPTKPEPTGSNPSTHQYADAAGDLAGNTPRAKGDK